MAFRILRVYGLITQSSKNVYNSELRSLNNVAKSVHLLLPRLPVEYAQRTTAFFTKKSGEDLWKSVVTVSNAGKRRGRGRGVSKKLKNLNIGQKIGTGKIKMLWPGLNSPILQGKALIQQQKLPDDPDYEKKIVALRDSSNRFRRTKLHPLLRGWTGAKLGGTRIGPPDPVGEEKFEGFDTIILEHKIVGHMTGNMGRKRTFSCFAVGGNQTGLVGIALGKGSDSATAIRNAKNSCVKKLIYINTYNKHTVFHDFFTQFGKTKIFVTQKFPGYGLVCHRAIKAVCEIIGIKDLHAKIEGTTNVQHIIKAFLIGLLRQKTHHELAEEKKLHLVEFRKENNYFPTVVASPSNIRTENQVSSTEVMDFTQHVMGGKVVLKKKKNPPFYTRERGWIRHLMKAEKLRDKEAVRIKLRAHYGELKSFLSDQYPEARPQYWHKKREEAEVES